jgi:hypothetical protein
MTIGLAMWKGGEPFKWLGKNIVIVGESVTDFGGFVDNVLAGGKKIQKNYDKLKDVIDTDK